MVREKLRPNARVNASTILEVVVSMLIILIVFSMAMTIYANVTRSSASSSQINARAVLGKLLAEAEKKADYIDETLVVDELIIQQNFKPRAESTDLIEVNFIAFDGNRQKIAELKKVIIKVHE